MTSPPFDIRSETENAGARLAVSGELDIASAPRLEEAIDAALARGVSSLLVDLGGITFIDSSGLRLLIELSDRASEEGWALSLIAPPEPSRSVFQITGADQNLPFVEPPVP